MTIPLKKSFFANPITWAFLVTLVYLIYLCLSTQMVIVFDSIGYEVLAKKLYHSDWSGYFIGGPNREPLYPMLISMTMRLSDLWGIPYQTILRIAQMALLILTQFLTLRFLEKVQVRSIIKALAILYIGISPAIVDSALSMYSEIVTYPLVLGILFMAVNCWQSRDSTNHFTSLKNGVLLGVMFILAALVKGVYSYILFFVLLPFVYLFWKSLRKGEKVPMVNSLIILLTALFTFQLFIVPYKLLNLKYNGNYTLTDRSSWALYGSAARRAQELNFKRILTAAAYIPGKGFCESVFSKGDCLLWGTETSDTFGLNKFSEVNARFPKNEVDKQLLIATKEKVLEHPFQFVFLTTFDALKMFFWESTKMGFITYPDWLQNIYDLTIFKNSLRLVISLLSFGAFLYIGALVFRHRLAQQFPYLFFALLLVLAHVGLYSLFNVVPRWALPIAPLYLILIAAALNNVLPDTKDKQDD